MANETTLNEIGEMLQHLVKASADYATKDDLKGFATKDDVRDIVRAEVPGIVREETKDIRDELASISGDLDRLTTTVENVLGFRKEIDYALERIAAIEKHLGIKKKIAA